MGNIFATPRDIAKSNNQDLDILVLGDSTGNSIVGDEGGEEWPLLLCRWLATQYPRHSVLYTANIDTGGWDDTIISSGSGDYQITLWNASGGGWDTDIFLNDAPHTALISGPTREIQYTIINLGHNEDDPLGSRWQDLFTLVAGEHPASQIVVMKQNPGTAAQIARQPLIAAEAFSAGYRTIDVFEAFLELGDYSHLMADTTHPNQSGQQFWADVLTGIWSMAETNEYVINRAELALNTRSYSGSGDWLDESGNGHHAASSDDSEVWVGPSWMPATDTDYGSAYYFQPPTSTAINMLESASLGDAYDGADVVEAWALVQCWDWANSGGLNQTMVLFNNIGGFNGFAMNINTFGHLEITMGNGVNNFLGGFVLSFVSTAGLVDGNTYWIKGKWEKEDGSGKAKVTGYYSLPTATPSWVEVGTATEAHGGNNTAEFGTVGMRIGNASAGSVSSPSKMRIYRVAMQADDVTMFDSDMGYLYGSFVDDLQGYDLGRELEDATGFSWRFRVPPYPTTGKGKPGFFYTDRPAWLRGEDDYHEITDNNSLDFAAGEDFTVSIVRRIADGTPASDMVLLAKKADLSTGAGYAIYLDTTGVPTFIIGDGSASVEATGPAITQGKIQVITAVRDTVADTITVYTDGVAGTPVTDTTTATLANAFAMRLDRLSDSGTNYGEGADFGAYVWREALSASEVKRLTTVLGAEGNDPALMHGDALQQWLLENETLTVTDTELVGMLNELNGTEGVEYAEARGTYLGVPPAG